MQLANNQVYTAEPLNPLAGNIRYKHLRNHKRCWRTGTRLPDNNGGFTIAYRHLSDEELVQVVGTDTIPGILVGFAGCSYEDNFDKLVGREIALMRLMQSRDIILGSEAIHKLLLARSSHEAYDVLYRPLAHQGIRYDLCVY
jgi:hypothetical protein